MHNAEIKQAPIDDNQKHGVLAVATTGLFGSGSFPIAVEVLHAASTTLKVSANVIKCSEYLVLRETRSVAQRSGN